MIFLALLAGGKGSRVGANVPKQFIDIAEKPILIHTLDVFVKLEAIDYIYISVNELWLEHTQKLINQQYDDSIRKKIRYVCGGKERMLSFLYVMSDIKENFGINASDIILSHDAVRPFVTKEIIEDCIEKTKKYKVAMAAILSADTTYASGKDGFLTSTYDRRNLYLGQTPQGCMMDFMDEIINSYTEEELLSMTGTSQLFINKNIDVKISLGSVDNLKITTMKDIRLMELLYK